MSLLFSRLTGFILILGAILGLILSLSGLVLLWASQATITLQISETLDTLDQTVQASTEMLSVMDHSLEQAETNIGLIETAIAGVSLTIENTAGTANSVGTMVGEDFTQVITDTQTTLDSVASSAKLIDDTLRIISAIPFIGARYQPDVPLQTTIGQVSDNIGDLTPSLTTIQTDLLATAESLGQIRSGLDELSASLNDIETNVASARSVLGQYTVLVNDLSEDISRLETSLPRWLRIISWGLTLGLIWLVIAQIGLLLQGLAFLSRPEPATYVLPPQQLLE